MKGYFVKQKVCLGRLQTTLGRPNVYHLGRVPETCCKRIVRTALRNDGGRESAVDIAVVAPGTSSSVGRVLGNRDVEGRRSVFCLRKLNRNRGNVGKSTYCCTLGTALDGKIWELKLT